MHGAREGPRRNRLDRLAKDIAASGLGPTGKVETEAEVVADAQWADVWYEPDPARGEERARLGLLGRMAETACTIEAFSDTPTADEVRACIHKHLAAWRSRGRGLEGSAPSLWILSTGRPETALAELWARPSAAWPAGVYEAATLLRAAIVVQSELPRDRTTVLLRLMSGGRVLRNAVEDLLALPADAPERAVAFPGLLRFRRAIGEDPTRTDDEEELMSMDDIVEEIREEGRSQGLSQGRAEGLHAAVEAVCELLGIALTAERRAEIDAMDAEALGALLARLRVERRWR